MKYLKIFWLAAAVIFCGYVNVNAEMVMNPDGNTLWIENGKNIKNGALEASADFWRAGLKLLPDPSGEGFIIDSNSGVDSQCATGRYVKVAPDYPWVVWEITAFTPIPGKSRGLALPIMSDIPSSPTTEFGSNIPSGIFAKNINDRGGVTKEGLCFLAIYAYNSKTNVKYLKLVKKPDNYAEMKSDTAAQKQKIELGDSVTFIVSLKEPAEDVSLRFYRSVYLEPLDINGGPTVQLKPEEGSDGKVWRATVLLKSISGDFKLFKPGEFMIKAVILGGELKVPVWGTNTYPVEPGKM
ncbi:MAG: hypothetical protein NTY10_03060 [Candidatus Omnitrophica bacterium]|nr:hypothetical protein [Candidatus Omnitrophota bacterium]